LAEQKKLCEKYGVPLVELEYDHSAWLAEIKGSEHCKERGERCEKCFAMRFRRGIEWAEKNEFGTIASVFGVSPHKDQAQVDRAMRKVQGAKCNYIKMNFAYAPENWIERQKYCGCEFSETYKK